ncbi:tricorn protease domain 2-containing protein [Dichomitus squalens LYAD-421 SS1]|uniref:Tricorn protease domain 2-containing protein n=1 Tax=Dichomitus squalens (strain LYAD-421) TaxID=732165 RepID=R7SXT2_DICSQ|nr:tricorn protease domain 2-containing protein [Dichomitus squalens LYAD-421 SS1]EJF60901.1 tricorn protease domain 2-containing protein [Dichomitus squalens LYAD-421 SS1]
MSFPVGGLGHDGPVGRALAISSDGQWVATGSSDSTIILWDGHHACICHEWIAHSGAMAHLAFSPNSRHLVSIAIVWGIHGESHSRLGAPKNCRSFLGTCAWSPDGALIAIGYYNCIVQVWDARTFESLALLDHLRTDFGRAPDFIFSPDSRWLVIWGGEMCGIWDVPSDTFKRPDVKGGDQAAYPAVAGLGVFSPGSTRLSVAYTDGSVHTWNVETAEEVAILQLPAAGSSWASAFSPDGWHLLFRTPDNAAKVVDIHTGAILASLQGDAHTTMWPVCFFPCGKYIASAAGFEVRLWRTGDGSCLGTLWSHDDAVTCLAFSAGGTMLWSAGSNGTVIGRRILDIFSEECTTESSSTLH